MDKKVPVSFAPEGQHGHQVGGVDFGVFVEVGHFVGEAGSPGNSLRIFFDKDEQDAQDLRKAVSDQLFLLFCEFCAFLRLISFRIYSIKLDH